MIAATSWQDVTVAIQRDRNSDGYVIVGLSQCGDVLYETRISYEAGRFLWAALVTIGKDVML